MLARKLLTLALLAGAASSCLGSDSGPLSPENATFAASLGVNLSAMTRTSSGVYYQDLTAGEGEMVAVGDTVTVHYTGWLRDGTQFDSSLDHGPATFRLIDGPGGVIVGWVLGLDGMREGGMRKLVIPSQFGYGAQSIGIIPSNSILVFDVQLLEVRKPDPEDDPN